MMSPIDGILSRDREGIRWWQGGSRQHRRRAGVVVLPFVIRSQPAPEPGASGYRRGGMKASLWLLAAAAATLAFGDDFEDRAKLIGKWQEEAASGKDSGTIWVLESKQD